MTEEDANAAVDAAIHNLAVSRGDVQDGELLTTWALIAAYQKAEDVDKTSYVIATAGGNQAPHVTAGLFSLGHDIALRMDE